MSADHTDAAGDDVSRSVGVSVDELVELLAERLADSDTVAAAAERLDRENPGTGAWHPAGLNGHAGIALFYAQLAGSDERHAGTAHAHLSAAMDAARTGQASGLYQGPVSVALAAQTCGARTGDYAVLRATLADWVADRQLTLLRATSGNPRAGVAEPAYDLVSGAAGRGRVLLDALDDPAENTAKVESAVVSTLRYLTRLSEPVTVRGRQVPGWWTTPEQFLFEHERSRHPDGAANAGMAHGIAGPIAVLAIAARRGVVVDGQLDALDALVGWLCAVGRIDRDEPFWPARVDFGEVAPRTRDAWCYGALGVAVALRHAGLALNRPDLRKLALFAVRGALSERFAAEDPYLCHGYAGALWIAHRLAVEEDDHELLVRARGLTRRVLESADPSAPFVVVAPAHTGGECSRAGLLEGAAGVGCVLASMAGTAGDRTWDRALLLS